jgi:excinuclease UvrABC helicase subunit UvrB
MARTVTVGTLLTRVRQRADRPVDDDFITDAEIIGYIDAAYTEIYDILVSKGIGQYESIQSISADGSATYSLPADFYACLGVDVRLDASDWIDLPMAQINERNYWSDDSTGYARAYRIHGSVIEFYPAPQSGQSYRMFYAPVAGTLDDTSDTVDGVNGWEEYIVVEAAIKCLTKEESSTTALERERERLLERVDAHAENRLQAEPRRVVDAQPFEYDPSDWWPRQAWW